jgi:hypothetical protein
VVQTENRNFIYPIILEKGAKAPVNVRFDHFYPGLKAGAMEAGKNKHLGL